MQTEILKITGMSCGGCVNAIKSALKAVPGVSDVNVSLATGETAVQFREGQTTHAKLHLAIEHAGYGVQTARVR